MKIWIRFAQRTENSMSPKDLATLQLEDSLAPQMGDLVGIDHSLYQVVEREWPNRSSRIQEPMIDPDVVQLYIGLERVRDDLVALDPNTSRH